jgi:hypothetical protein
MVAGNGDLEAKEGRPSVRHRPHDTLSVETDNPLVLLLLLPPPAAIT